MAAFPAPLLTKEQPPQLARSSLHLSTRSTLALLQPLTACSVISVARGAKEHGKYTENGVDAGVTAVADIELLAKGDHIIGTYGSTFTLLIQAVIAHRYIQSVTAESVTAESVTAESVTAGPEGRVTEAGSANGGEKTTIRREQPTVIYCESVGCMRPLPLIADWHVSLQRWPASTVWVG